MYQQKFLTFEKISWETIIKHRKLEILAELHHPEAHIWGDRRGQPIHSATGSKFES